MKILLKCNVFLLKVNHVTDFFRQMKFLLSGKGWKCVRTCWEVDFRLLVIVFSDIVWVMYDELRSCVLCGILIVSFLSSLVAAGKYFTWINSSFHNQLFFFFVTFYFFTSIILIITVFTFIISIIIWSLCHFFFQLNCHLPPSPLPLS